MFKRFTAFALVFILLFSITVTATPSDWAYREVTDAVLAGLVPATMKGKHQDPINRMEFCEMTMLLYEKVSKSIITPGKHFEDTENESVNKAFELGIVNGTGEGIFSPYNAISRQEICTMLTRAYKVMKPQSVIPAEFPNTFPDTSLIADWALEAVQFMNLCNIMIGDEYGNINPLGNTTREQAIILVYRLYKSMSANAVEYFTSLLGGGGNQHFNMLNGGFATFCYDGFMYFSDGKGVKNIDTKEYLFETDVVKNFEAYSDSVYYIGAEDFIYFYDRTKGVITKLTDKPAESFTCISKKLYFKNASTGKVEVIDLKDGTISDFTDTVTGLPVFEGSDTYYSDYSSIIKKETGVIYTGENKGLSSYNKRLYFINGDGFLASVNYDGADYKVIAEKEVTQYCPTSSCIIVLDKNGHIYKMDYEGRYFIKLDKDSYDSINTYESQIFARKSDGTIYSLKNNATDKTLVN